MVPHCVVEQGLEGALVLILRSLFWRELSVRSSIVLSASLCADGARPGPADDLRPQPGLASFPLAIAGSRTLSLPLAHVELLHLV